MSVVKEHLSLSRQLLAERGAIVVHLGDGELGYGRLVADEVLGIENFLGTVVWQTHYSPKGGKPTKDIAAIHDHLLFYAANRDRLSLSGSLYCRRATRIQTATPTVTGRPGRRTRVAIQPRFVTTFHLIGGSWSRGSSLPDYGRSIRSLVLSPGRLRSPGALRSRLRCLTKLANRASDR